MSEPLAVYLEDHLSGARFALELLQAMRDNQHLLRLKEFVVTLLAEVEADVDTLQGLAESMGAGSNIFKELAGWVGEKATRIKLGQSTGDDLGTFEALEFLALGVLGKASLWEALDVVAVSDERLHGYDFEQLAASARVQYAKVEHQRLESAKTALRPKLTR